MDELLPSGQVKQEGVDYGERAEKDECASPSKPLTFSVSIGRKPRIETKSVESLGK